MSKKKPVETKPGPKPGHNLTKVECPYCGGKAHRKAVQTLKGVGTYRRHYCADGCGHYHYRDVDTNDIVEVGVGPRECKLHSVKTDDTKDDDAEIKRLRNAIDKMKKELAKPITVASIVETSLVNVHFENELAASLGIDAAALVFTAKNDSGRPRALVNCLSAGDIAALSSDEDRDNVQRLHRALLTTQACIGVYREKAQASIKSAKTKIQ